MPCCFNQKPCRAGERDWSTGQPTMAANGRPFASANRVSKAFMMPKADAMTGEEGQERQQRQAEDGEIVAFDLAEQVRADALKAIGADRGGHAVAGLGKVGIEKGLARS